MDNKKARERKYLDELARINPEFPIGEIIDFESPDFLIKQNNKTIGIEIVDYVRGQINGESAERRNEVLRMQVVTKAKEQFETKHNIPILIRILWNKRYSLCQSKTIELVNEVVRLVENNVPPELLGVTRIGREEIEDSLINGVCHSITIMRTRNKQQIGFISSGWIEAQTNEIQYLIETKNNKAKEYLINCDEIWLIIVADGRYITSNIDLPETMVNNVYKSCFAQVLLYDRFGKNVFPLRLQRV